MKAANFGVAQVCGAHVEAARMRGVLGRVGYLIA
jgi:hypothetical protein